MQYLPHTYETFKSIQQYLSVFLSPTNTKIEDVKKIIVYSLNESSPDINLLQKILPLSKTQVFKEYTEIYFLTWVAVEEALRTIQNKFNYLFAGYAFHQIELSEIYNEKMLNRQNKTNEYQKLDSQNTEYSIVNVTSGNESKISNASTNLLKNTSKHLNQTSSVTNDKKNCPKPTEFVEVYGLPYRMTDADLYIFFSKYNPIKINRSYRCVHVKCSSSLNCKKMIEDLNGIIYKRQTLLIGYSNHHKLLKNEYSKYKNK